MGPALEDRGQACRRPITTEGCVELGQVVRIWGLQLRLALVRRADSENRCCRYARLNRAFQTLVTGGESWHTLEQFYRFWKAGAYSVVQLDAGETGGHGSLAHRKSSHTVLASRSAPSSHNGLLLTMQAHLVAALPEPPVRELCMHQGPLQWSLALAGGPKAPALEWAGFGCLSRRERRHGRPPLCTRWASNAPL